MHPELCTMNCSLRIINSAFCILNSAFCILNSAFCILNYALTNRSPVYIVLAQLAESVP